MSWKTITVTNSTCCIIRKSCIATQNKEHMFMKMHYFLEGQWLFNVVYLYLQISCHSAIVLIKCAHYKQASVAWKKAKKKKLQNYQLIIINYQLIIWGCMHSLMYINQQNIAKVWDNKYRMLLVQWVQKVFHYLPLYRFMITNVKLDLASHSIRGCSHFKVTSSCFQVHPTTQSNMYVHLSKLILKL